MVSYYDTHAACGSNFRICTNDESTEETEWRANITHNMNKIAAQVPISLKYRNKEYKEACEDNPGCKIGVDFCAVSPVQSLTLLSASSAQVFLATWFPSYFLS